MSVLRVFEVEIKGYRGVKTFDSQTEAQDYATCAATWNGLAYRITPRTRFVGGEIITEMRA